MLLCTKLKKKIINIGRQNEHFEARKNCTEFCLVIIIHPYVQFTLIGSQFYPPCYLRYSNCNFLYCSYIVSNNSCYEKLQLLNRLWMKYASNIFAGMRNKLVLQCMFYIKPKYILSDSSSNAKGRDKMNDSLSDFATFFEERNIATNAFYKNILY